MAILLKASLRQQTLVYLIPHQPLKLEISTGEKLFFETMSVREYNITIQPTHTSIILNLSRTVIINKKLTIIFMNRGRLYYMESNLYVLSTIWNLIA